MVAPKLPNTHAKHDARCNSLAARKNTWSRKNRSGGARTGVGVGGGVGAQ